MVWQIGRWRKRRNSRLQSSPTTNWEKVQENLPIDDDSGHDIVNNKNMEMSDDDLIDFILMPMRAVFF